jgi:hypothetical protein
MAEQAFSESDRDEKERDTRQPPERSQIESFVRELLGSSVADRAARQGSEQERSGDRSMLYDAQGKPINTLIGHDGPVFGVSRNDGGKIEINSFASSESALKLKPQEKCVLGYSTNGNTLSETCCVFDDKAQLKLTTVTTLDRDREKLTIEAKTANEHQTVSYENGRFTELQLKSGNGQGDQPTKILSVQFSPDGKINDVLLNSKPLHGQLAADFFEAVKRTLLTVGRENGLPVPASFEASTSNSVASNELRLLAGSEDSLAEAVRSTFHADMLSEARDDFGSPAQAGDSQAVQSESDTIINLLSDLLTAVPAEAIAGQSDQSGKSTDDPVFFASAEFAPEPIAEKQQAADLDSDQPALMPPNVEAAGADIGVVSPPFDKAKDKIDQDPLTDTRQPADPRLTWKRAVDSGVPLPPLLKPENLFLPRGLQLPEKIPIIAADGTVTEKGPTLSQIASERKLDPMTETSYYLKAFMTTDNPSIRTEAICGLREMITSGKNPSALHQFQEIMAVKAATELKEAEANGDQNTQKKALTELAAIAQFNSLARDILNGKKGENGAPDIPPHPLAEQAKQAAVQLAKETFAPIDQAVGSFLARNDGSTPEDRQRQRKAAIGDLESANQQRLNLMNRDDFTAVSRTFKALDAGLTLKETESPDQAAKALKSLLDMASDVSLPNTEANGILNTLERKLGGEAQFQKAIDALKGGGEDGLKALEKLQKALPDLTETLDQFRLDRIMKGIQPAAAASEFERAAAELKAEKTAGNKGAEQLLQWAESSAAIQRMNEKLQVLNPESPQSAETARKVVSEEIANLKQQMLEGNPHAKLALLGLLNGKTDKPAAEDWQLSGNMSPVLANLDKLSLKDRQELKLNVVEIFQKELERSNLEESKLNTNTAETVSPPKPFLSKDDGVALAVTLAEASQSGNQELQSLLQKTFDTAYQGSSAGSALEGIFRTIETGAPGTDILAEVYIGGSSDKSVVKHLNSMGLMVGDGNVVATRVLALMAAGQGQGEYSTMLAGAAGRSLERAADSPSNRPLIYQEMLSANRLHGDDTGILMKTLGLTASRDQGAPPAVRDALRHGFETAANRPWSPAYAGALEGMLRTAPQWGRADYETLRQHCNSDVLAGLKQIAPQVPERLRNFILEDQKHFLTLGEPEERLRALRIMGDFAKWATPEQATEVAFFGSEKGKKELGAAGMSPEMMKDFGDRLSATIVSMLGAQNPKTQDAVFNALREKRDWSGVLSNELTRKEIINYVQNRPTNLETNAEAMKLLYDAGVSRPLAGIFKDLGIRGEAGKDSDLFAIADRAVKNYSSDSVDGKAVVERVLSNAVRLNALHPAIREQMTGSADPIDVQKVIGQLANGVIDAGRPPNNPLFANLEGKLLELRETLTVKHSETRRDLAGLSKERATSIRALGQHTVQDKISSGEWLADKFFGTDFKESFADNQGLNVRRIEGIDQRIEKKEEAHAALAWQLSCIEIAIQAGDHFKLTQTNQKEADRKLMSLIAEYGPSYLQNIAPFTYGQAAGAFQRLKENGLGNSDFVPNYGNPSNPQAFDFSQFDRALAGLKEIRTNNSSGKFSADRNALQKIAFEKIDSLPAFCEMQRAAKDVVFSTTLLNEMFVSGLNGTRTEVFINKAKEQAQELKELLGQITPEHRMEARKALVKMEEALKTMSPEVDADTRAMLKERIEGMKQAIELFDPNSAKNHSFRNMLQTVLDSDKFDESTFTNWLKKDGLPMVAAIVAAAAVIAATGGGAAPLLLAPAAGLLAGEVTKDVLRVAGVRTEGSALIDTARGRMVFDPETKRMRQMDLAKDVIVGYGKQYLTDLTVTLATMGLAKGLNTTVGSLGSKTSAEALAPHSGKLHDLARGLQKAEAVANATGNPGFVKQFFKEFRGQSNFAAEATAAEIGLEIVTGQDHLSELVKHLPAICIGAGKGMQFKPEPTGKVIRFDLEPAKRGEAKQQISDQMVQFYNNGNTVRPVAGKPGAFDVISPAGKTTRFEPSAELSKHVADFKDPAWLRSRQSDDGQKSHEHSDGAGKSSTEQAKAAEQIGATGGSKPAEANAVSPAKPIETPQAAASLKPDAAKQTPLKDLSSLRELRKSLTEEPLRMDQIPKAERARDLNESQPVLEGKTAEEMRRAYPELMDPKVLRELSAELGKVYESALFKADLSSKATFLDALPTVREHMEAQIRAKRDIADGTDFDPKALLSERLQARAEAAKQIERYEEKLYGTKRPDGTREKNGYDSLEPRYIKELSEALTARAQAIQETFNKVIRENKLNLPEFRAVGDIKIDAFGLYHTGMGDVSLSKGALAKGRALLESELLQKNPAEFERKQTALSESERLRTALAVHEYLHKLQDILQTRSAIEKAAIKLKVPQIDPTNELHIQTVQDAYKSVTSVKGYKSIEVSPKLIREAAEIHAKSPWTKELQEMAKRLEAAERSYKFDLDALTAFSRQSQCINKALDLLEGKGAPGGDKARPTVTGHPIGDLFTQMATPDSRLNNFNKDRGGTEQRESLLGSQGMTPELQQASRALMEKFESWKDARDRGQQMEKKWMDQTQREYLDYLKARAHQLNENIKPEADGYFKNLKEVQAFGSMALIDQALGLRKGDSTSNSSLVKPGEGLPGAGDAAPPRGKGGDKTVGDQIAPQKLEEKSSKAADMLDKSSVEKDSANYSISLERNSEKSKSKDWDATDKARAKVLVRDLSKQGWPREEAVKYSRSLDSKELEQALRGMDSKEARAVFFGTEQPFDPVKLGRMDEVSTAATALDQHTFGQNAYINVVEGVSPEHVKARFGEGDTSFYEQAFRLDRDKMPDNLKVYSVPKEKFQKILDQIGSEHTTRVLDLEATPPVSFLTVKPGHDAAVGRKVIEAVKKEGIEPVPFTANSEK